MKCPNCGFEESKVLDSRPLENSIRRRRMCNECGYRFTTFETAEKPLLMVVKKDGSYEPYDRNKLIRGVYNAIKKRPVSTQQVEKISDSIESHCANKMVSQISTADIGSMILKQLREIDDVAYIRFASVYKDFSDAESFAKEILSLNDKKQH